MHVFYHVYSALYVFLTQSVVNIKRNLFTLSKAKLKGIKFCATNKEVNYYFLFSA